MEERSGEDLPRLRRSARAFVFDRESGELLLIRFEGEANLVPFCFWITPGGEIEAGEDERAAAEREVREEVGLEMELVGPVYREEGGTYVHLGEVVRHAAVFFAGVCDRSGPKLQGVDATEAAMMREARWWPVEELARTEERVYPRGCAELAEAVWASFSAEELVKSRPSLL